jgi:uncharacterized repeat protein (TIGR04052 family)
MSRLSWSPARSLCLPLAAVLVLAGCGGTSDEDEMATFSVDFSPLVGGEPFDCSVTYEGIGTSQTTMNALDFRMYIHGVKLVRAGGEEVPLSLEQDAKWQRDDVALLDFEDGSGTCATGSPETRLAVVGDAPAHDDYAGVTFTVGIPPEKNHLDAATAPAPFNIPGMWWSWKGGYKFVRLDVQSPMNDAYYLHLGESSCAGTPGQGFTCESANQAVITLSGFVPGTTRVEVDVKDIYAESDLNRQIDGQTDHIPGCMASASDPECEVIFRKLGMQLGSGLPSADPQTFFRAR